VDSLTQIVLGAAVGEATLGKKVGNRAMMWGAIAGTIPDLDVLLRLMVDQVTATEWHRGFSHSIVFCLLLAPILGWFVNWIHKKRNVGVKGWTWLFFMALVTHPLLDAHTTWGTQFFWPFDLRLAYKNIFVVDPLYTVPFIICVLIAMFYKRTNPKRQKWNRWGIYISSGYMAITILLKAVTYSEFKEQLREQGISYVEMDTRPTPLNTILWNAQIKTENGFVMAYYSLFDSKPIQFSEEIPRNDTLIEQYKDQKVIKQLKKISEGWYFIEEEEGKLYFVDLRFGQMGFDPNADDFLWKFELTTNEKGELNPERIRPDMTKIGGFGDAVTSLWDRIKGN
jgi:inner membrane protein